MKTGKGQSETALVALLQSYTAAGVPTAAELQHVPGLGSRFALVLSTRTEFLHSSFIHSADKESFRQTLLSAYRQCQPLAVFPNQLEKKADLLRHGLSHLLHCPDSLWQKLDRFLAPNGAYFIPGLGEAFWSAMFQAVDPLLVPAALSTVWEGVSKIGLLTGVATMNAVTRYGKLIELYQTLLQRFPYISALHLDHFFSLVATMEGRHLWSGQDKLAHIRMGLNIDTVLSQFRADNYVREHVKTHGERLQKWRQIMDAALTNGNVQSLASVLHEVWQYYGKMQSPCMEPLTEATLRSMQSLWDSPSIHHTEELSPVLSSILLHLREPDNYFPWNPNIASGFRGLITEVHGLFEFADLYPLYCEAVPHLARELKLHPLQVPTFLAQCGNRASGKEDKNGLQSRFLGFGPDTFRFLEELQEHNDRDWMTDNRCRYHYFLRQPLVQLGRELADRYVRPVLNGKWGLQLETQIRTGKVLSSICKNDYGRSKPYSEEMWMAFTRKEKGHKKYDAQLFVRLTAHSVSFGLRIGKHARDVAERLRANIADHGETIWRALNDSGFLQLGKFANDVDWQSLIEIKSPTELATWAESKLLLAGVTLPTTSEVLRSEEFIGEIMLVWDRLLPLYFAAVLDDPRVGLPMDAVTTGRHRSVSGLSFATQTLLPESWLGNARKLLDLKRQLILQGVPGTGKTFVARHLARWLVGGDEDNVRLVQFHPAYSYEEFVEGIKAKTVKSNGRRDVSYQVQDGVLCDFAAHARKNPQRNFVLIIDEINRGNLPRIFGELLYLLEYRNQTVVLPYSRREFQLPTNLFLIATMNAADRSVTMLDQALRRRFSFLEMAPDKRILSDWLTQHGCAAGAGFPEMVTELFEELNAKLVKELGKPYRIGHSYFMVPDLDEEKLQAIWIHQVRPLLEEYFAGQLGRVEAFDPDRLFQRRWQTYTEKSRKKVNEPL